MMIKLVDIVQIQPDAKYADFSKKEKFQFMDRVLQQADSTNKRGLLIHFGLSNSGRRINNRIYTPRGQRDGVTTWTDPYPKPIILNHDKEGDPLGRFTSVEWVSTEDQALSFFKNINDYMQLQDAFDSDNPKKIYRTLKKFNLLTNRRWPGLGVLKASARITDEDAIEKFLDGRYLTFSAGSHTDRYCCGKHGDDWAQGDICDCRPGAIDADGDMGIFVTGAYHGDEASVLNMPANDFSQIYSMEFIDSVDLNRTVSVDSRRIDTSTIYTTDAKLSIGEPPMKKKEEVQEETKTEDSVEEVQDENSGEVTQASVDGKPNDSSASESEESETTVLADDRSALIKEVTDAVLAALEAKKAEDTDDTATQEDANTENVESTDSKAETKTEDTDLDIDWQILDLALEAELIRLSVEDEDAKKSLLSAEDREALDESAFAGPERSFPVTARAHVTAARKLIDRAKLTSDQKEKILAWVDEKAQTLDSNETNKDLDTLREDYVEALKTIDNLREELKSLKKRLEDADSTHDTIQNEAKTGIQDVKQVENPSVDSSDSNAPSASSTETKVSAFTQKVLTRYKDIKDKEGQDLAEEYIAKLKFRGYIPRNFDPKQLIEEL